MELTAARWTVYLTTCKNYKPANYKPKETQTAIEKKSHILHGSDYVINGNTLLWLKYERVWFEKWNTLESNQFIPKVSFI